MLYVFRLWDLVCRLHALRRFRRDFYFVVTSESPQNDPEGTEMTQGDSKYGEQDLFMYFITNFYDIQKVYKSDPKSENGSNSKLTAWAACGFVENSSNSSFLI